MNLLDIVEEIKGLPEYSQKCGMILTHNGSVRAWSRDGGKKVLWVDTVIDRSVLADICREHEKMSGIFAIRAHGFEGRLKPGDDLLFLAVAGDLRENVISCMSSLLDQVKSRAVTKHEELE